MTKFIAASSRQRFRWFNLTAAILLVGLLVRLIVFAAIVINPQRAFSAGDSDEYTLLAHNLAVYSNFSLSQSAPFAPDLTRTPGYPVLLELLYVVSGNQHNANLIIGLQVVLSLANIYLLLLIGKLLFKADIAAIAALLYALSPAAITYAGLVMSETVFAALLLYGIYATLKVRGSTNPWRYTIFAGVSFALSVLVRPIGLYFLPLPMLALILQLGWQRRAIALALTMALSFALVLAPWFYRNYVDFHAVIFTSLANSNLLIYNVGSVEAQRQHISWREAKDQLWQELTIETNKSGDQALSSSEISDLMGSIAMKHILAHPADAFIYQTLDMANSFRPGYSTVALLLEDGKTQAGIDAQQGDLTAIATAPMPDKAIYILITLFYLLLFPLVAAGLVMLVWNRKWTALVICGLIPLWFVYVPGIAGNARFRAPIEGLLALIAAVPLAWIIARLRTRIGRRQEQPDT